MSRRKKITLCWYAKTPNGWRYFPALHETHHGVIQAKHGWVRDKGLRVEYPQGRYVLRSYVNGKKTYTPIDTCNPTIAAAIASKAQKAAIGASNAQSKLGIIRHAADAYIKELRDSGAMEAAAQARLTLDEFVSVAGTTYVRMVTRQSVLTYHKAMRKRELSPRTIANRHNRLKSFLRWCKVPVDFMPAAPRYEKGLPTVYASADTAAILAGADDYMRLAISLGLKLGLRELEIAHAEWSDVHWEDSVFRVSGKPHWGFKVKDAEERDVPIPSDLLALLKNWRDRHRRSKLILGTKRGKPNWHLLRALKRLARRLGLNCGECGGCQSDAEECANWTLHKLRRTYCTTLLRQGVDARTVQAWAGHADLPTTMRYLRPSAAKESQDKVNSVVW